MQIQKNKRFAGEEQSWPSRCFSHDQGRFKLVEAQAITSSNSQYAGLMEGEGSKILLHPTTSSSSELDGTRNMLSGRLKDSMGFLMQLIALAGKWGLRKQNPFLKFLGQLDLQSLQFKSLLCLSSSRARTTGCRHLSLIPQEVGLEWVESKCEWSFLTVNLSQWTYLAHSSARRTCYAPKQTMQRKEKKPQQCIKHGHGCKPFQKHLLLGLSIFRLRLHALQTKWLLM